MEFGKAFSYVFEDQSWLTKIVIGGLILLIPILGSFVLLGWMVEIIRRVIVNDPEPLPEWGDFGGHLGRGFQALVIGLVYALPVILLAACVNIIPLLAANQDNDAVTTLVTLLSVCFGCLIFIFALALNLVIPAALGQFAATGQLGAALRFGEVFGLVRAAPMAFVMCLLGAIVANLVASLGVIACFIGLLFTQVWAGAVMAHLYGQAYKQAKAAQGMAGGMAY